MTIFKALGEIMKTPELEIIDILNPGISNKKAFPKDIKNSGNGKMTQVRHLKRMEPNIQGFSVQEQLFYKKFTT
jgi:hypothetical protein